MALTQNQIDYLENVNQDDVEIQTLEFIHPVLSNNISICRYFNKKEFMLENGELMEFDSVNFMVKPTSYSPKLQDSKLDFAVDIIDFEIARKIREIVTSDIKLKVIYRSFSKNSNELIFGPQRFEVETMSIQNSKLTATCNYYNFVNIKFPSEVVDENEYPGLRYV